MVTQSEITSEVNVSSLSPTTIIISALIAGNLMVLAVLALVYMAL